MLEYGLKMPHIGTINEFGISFIASSESDGQSTVQ